MADRELAKRSFVNRTYKALFLARARHYCPRVVSAPWWPVKAVTSGVLAVRIWRGLAWAAREEGVQNTPHRAAGTGLGLSQCSSRLAGISMHVPAHLTLTQMHDDGEQGGPEGSQSLESKSQCAVPGLCQLHEC